MPRFVVRVKNTLVSWYRRLLAYIKRLLFPLYLFPVKLLTYSLYYMVRLVLRLIIDFIRMIFDALMFPFSSLKNLTKTFFLFGLAGYIAASLVIMTDYVKRHYGWWDKYFCAFGEKGALADKTVRIVGGWGEGSGFFIAPDQVLTNFHVIDGEPSPKIIFPKDFFVTPVKIVGNREADLAVLYTDKPYPYMVMPLRETFDLMEDEPLLASGYPLGSMITGKATVKEGPLIGGRWSSYQPVDYIQAEIELVPGMSGGPLTDICGAVVGVNTMGVSGLSLFINGAAAAEMVPVLNDQNVATINVDPSLSPQDGVIAFYTYLKARQMEKGFALLSQEYLKKTDYVEWTNRFTDVLDVNVISTSVEKQPKDTVLVKFTTSNWAQGERFEHYYEGTWATVQEDGVYKMLRSNIAEVYEPGGEWFW